MLITPNLQKQHVEMLHICDEVLDMLPLLREKDNVLEVKRKIYSSMNLLFGKLLVHKSMEDKVIYPDAINAKEDSILSAKAMQMAKEMSAIKDKAVVYRSNLILREEGNLDRFIEETICLLHSLQRIINKEDQELYPLLQKYKEKQQQNLLLK